MPDKEVDFTEETRNALFSSEKATPPQRVGGSAAVNPTRHIRRKVTMNIDADILAHFKEEAKKTCRSYQLLINEALRENIEGSKPEQIASLVKTLLQEDREFICSLAKQIQIKREI